jgi:hypothetical protein
LCSIRPGIGAVSPCLVSDLLRMLFVSCAHNCQACQRFCFSPV